MIIKSVIAERCKALHSTGQHFSSCRTRTHTQHHTQAHLRFPRPEPRQEVISQQRGRADYRAALGTQVCENEGLDGLVQQKRLSLEDLCPVPA